MENEILIVRFLNLRKALHILELEIWQDIQDMPAPDRRWYVYDDIFTAIDEIGDILVGEKDWGNYDD